MDDEDPVLPDCRPPSSFWFQDNRKDLDVHQMTVRLSGWSQMAPGNEHRGTIQDHLSRAQSLEWEYPPKLVPSLVWDKDNKYSETAIACQTEDNVFFGWIPERISRAVLRLIQRSQITRIRIEISMKAYGQKSPLIATCHVYYTPWEMMGSDDERSIRAVCDEIE